MTDVAAPETSYTCPYCRQTSDGTATSCPTCGAPVNIQLRTTKSGWTELPSIADMARIQFGRSRCQVEGRLVPVAEMTLAAGDGVYFTHDVLLWQDPAVTGERLADGQTMVAFAIGDAVGNAAGRRARTDRLCARQPR